MKKMILIGRSASGKTTLKQVLNDRALQYEKTQAVEYENFIIDTPGEYIQDKSLGGALAVYSYEADIIGLVIQATEPFTLFPPNVVCMANREVVGIITKIDEPYANIPQAKMWLTLSGCKKIFCVSSYTKEGIEELKEYLEKENGGEQCKTSTK